MWNRLDWVIEKVKLDPQRVFAVLDWCHGVHHISLALEDLGLSKADRKECYARLRKLFKQGKANAVIEELESLAKGRPAKSDVWRAIRYLHKHCDADRLRYAVFRSRNLPIGSGAIESTIRRVINLRLKGNSIYWTEDNAEAVFALRAALLSGRWDDIITHTRDAIARAARLLPPDRPATHETFARALAQAYHADDAPDVDLLIRTGGEKRLSDFLLWECAYAELYFTDARWPDFGEAELATALETFHGRERRYGRVA
ncbi:MAG: undecaprenyl diphosphate synthase family protein [Bacteroidetes bacterium]|nr:undecaprenyl diphosphate synthase family protein [Bacteroidota bacterium]